MKRLALVAATVAAMVLPSAALATGGPVGKYSAKVATAGSLKGTWTLQFTRAGTYSVAQNGQIGVHGHYTTAGSKITFSRESGLLGCLDTGKYTWKHTGKKLTFTRISDSKCVGRAAILALTFRQV